MILKNFHTIEFKEKEVTKIDENELTNFLFNIYGMNPQPISSDMSDEEMAIMYFQTNEIIDRLKYLGFHNFAPLNEKFNSIPVYFNSNSDADRCKKLLERILFISHLQGPKLNQYYAAKFGNYEFICGPGCLDNLSEILQDMTSIKRDFHDIVINEKKKLVKYGLNQLIQQGSFDEILPNRNITMEIHYVKYLFNAIAKKMLLNEEDIKSEFKDLLQDFSEHKIYIYGQIKNVLEQRPAEEALIDNVTEVIIKSLPSNLEYLNSNAAKIQAMQEHLEHLNLPVNDVSIYHFLNIDENYLVLGYRKNLRSSIHAIVTTFFHQKNIIPDPNLEFTKKIFKLNSQITIPKSLVGEYSMNKIWNYIRQCDLKLDFSDFGANSVFEFMNTEQIRSFINSNPKILGYDSLLYILNQNYKYEFSESEKIHMLFQSNDIREIQAILRHDPKLNYVRISDGCSALTHHLKIGNSNIANLLKNAGAPEIDLKERIFNLLKCPPGSKDVAIIKLLTQHPNLLGAVNSEGDNVLHLIFQQKPQPRMVAFLNSQLANTEKILLVKNKKGETPLELAIKKADKNLTLNLIEQLAKKDPDISKQSNLIPKALERGSLSIFKALSKLKKFNILLVKKNEYAETPLHLCFKKSLSDGDFKKNLKFIKKILKISPYSILDVDLKGHNIAHYAAQAQSDELLKFVYEKSPNLLKSEDQEKATPLCLAIAKNMTHNVKFIVYKFQGDGILFAKYFNNANLFHIAISNSATNAFDCLLDLPFNEIKPLLQEKTNLGTPLELAQKLGKIEFAQKIQQKMDQGLKKQHDEQDKETEYLGKFTRDATSGSNKRSRVL